MTAVDDININRAVKVSEFIEAYDFEVYDISRTLAYLEGLRPLLFLSIALYLSGVYFGQKWMKNRPAFKLEKPLFFWNLGLSIFSIVATIRAFPEIAHLLTIPDGLYLAVCSLEQHNFATSFWGVIFLLSKFVELGDTAFIVLRKQKLIVLHWLHHVITLVVAWAGMEYYDTHVRFYLMNTFVHSFMYTYYALRALKYRIPRRLAMTLTTLQIFQMICYIFVNGYSLYKMGQGLPCNRHKNVIYLVVLAAATFGALFVNFFIRTYLRRWRNTKTHCQ